MQSTGQYGVSDSPQFLVKRAPTPQLFSISHDSIISLSSPPSHPHTALHTHPLTHHLQVPQQHHYGSRLTHPALQAHQQQQMHQAPTGHAQHAQHLQHQQHQQHLQHSLGQLHKQQQQQLPAASHQDIHLQQQQQEEQAKHAQEQMVKQLGLGDPDSPEVPSPIITSHSSATHHSKLLVSAQHDDEGLEEDGRGSSGGSRWPRAETLALIQIRSEMDASFRDSAVKGPLWDEVSRKLADQGYQRSGKKCKEKFENIHKYYKKSKDGRVGRQDGKTYRFFAQLEALFGGQPTPTQVETDTAAAVLLIGAGAPHGIPPAEDLHVSAVQLSRPSEVRAAETLSKSSDDDYDGPLRDAQVGKSKKKMTKKRKHFQLEDESEATRKLDVMESMMKTLVEQQERLQRKFFQSMEKMELERQVKEEQWRKQEGTRWSREYELRLQKHALAASRDAALIAFLQEATFPGQSAKGARKSSLALEWDPNGENACGSREEGNATDSLTPTHKEPHFRAVLSDVQRLFTGNVRPD